MKLQTAYKNTAGLIPDPQQAMVVDLLAELQARLADAGDRRKSWLSRLMPRRSRIPVPGIYLWGPVGRGKTFLMDLFFDTLATEQKTRVHFHRLMSDVHRRLKDMQDRENPLDVIAESMASEARVLCFDEFFVNDIGDAMILGGLLDGLIRHGVTLVATSNSPPAELYRDGLQRERFLPAIRLLETHTRLVALDGGADFRLRLLQQAGTLFAADDPDIQSQLGACFARIAALDHASSGSIDVLGRPIAVVREAAGVAWFDFSDLCEGPRSQQDYIEIARCYHTVIVQNVPVLGRDDEDAARRFIALVDEFYDRRVNLILSTAASIDSLYQGTRLTFEFERTRSRLTEMQSEAYLSEAHLA